MASPPDTPLVRAALLGATGRMGTALVRALDRSTDVELVAAATRAKSAHIGKPLSGTHLSLQTAAHALADVDVAIDFSLPEATAAHAALCQQHGVAYVSGVTGLSAEQHASLEGLAEHVPVMWSANMSLAVNACFLSAAELARSLATDGLTTNGLAMDKGNGDEAMAINLASGRSSDVLQVHILDIHHVVKKDAPSGTALAFGEAILHANPAAEVTYDSRREGAHPGEHVIRFTRNDEFVELRHRAGSRERFADGAVQAAQWLVGQSAGQYKMTDLLRITTSG